MTSRLDRLFILLESGSSAVTRKAAAKQIGEVQKLHPHELHNLLNRLIVYLHSASWDTRIAAAQAVDAILSNVPQWQPNAAPPSKTNGVPMNYDSDRLQFCSFDVAKVLNKGARLMGSEGTEFDCQDDAELMDSRENLQRQRSLLNEKLGFNTAAAIGINIGDLVTLDDMRNHNSHNNGITEEPFAGGNGQMNGAHQRLMPVQEILRQSTASNNSSQSAADALSCREMNRAKRKARQSTTLGNSNGTSAAGSSGGGGGSAGASALSRSNSTASNGGGTACDNGFGEPDRKTAKLDVKEDFTHAPVNYPVPDGTGLWGDTVDWPLEAFCARLYLDLFHPRWETRHGAATALRELLKSHSAGAGTCEGMTAQEMELNHLHWLEDACLRLLCVLALDRFGDFISDQVVAPVRETCAQVLGAILKELPVDKVMATIRILLSLVCQSDWEVRHGGLLGIKYMLVVREDLLQTFLPITINPILAGLFDTVDDVGAVAASTLIPIAAWLPKLLTAAQVSGIVKMLWDLLLDQDELTSACNSFMGLLSAILSLKDASKWIQMEPMDMLIPRLWPFLSHNSSSVRRSTLQTLKTLTEITTTNHSISVIMMNSEGTNAAMPKAEPSVKLEHSDLDKVLKSESKQLELNFGVKHWTAALLQEALRHIYQRVLIEHMADIQSIAEDVWNNLVSHAELSALLHASCPYVAAWMCLAMQPARLAFDPAQMIYSKLTRERKNNRWHELMDANAATTAANNKQQQQKMYLGGIETTSLEVRERNVPRARCKAAKMLGLLSRYLVLPAPGVVYTDTIESPINCYAKILIGYLASRSALQRLISGMIVAFWAQFDTTLAPGPALLTQRLQVSLVEYVYYDEVAVSLTRLLQEARDLLATLKQNKVAVGGDLDTTKILTLDQIQSLATTLTENLGVRFALKPKLATMLEERRRGLQQSFAQTNADQTSLNISTQAVLAGATASMECLPDKLNPVIKPLMESIKREECEHFQQQSATYLVRLLDQVAGRQPCPNNKIVTNLCTLLKSDTDFTPTITATTKTVLQFNAGDLTAANPYHGILTLDNQHKSSNNNSCNGSSGTRGPGRPPTVSTDAAAAAASAAAAAAADDATTTATFSDLDEQKKQLANRINRIQRIGATFAIKAICEHFGAGLAAKLPILWSIVNKVKQLVPDDAAIAQMNVVDFALANELITCLQLIELMAPHVHPSLQRGFMELLPQLTLLLRHPLKAIRHMSARCLATLATIDPSTVMSEIVDRVVALLHVIERSIDRQGAAEAIACIVNTLQFKIVPYVILLVVPLLGRMSDPDTSVRLMSTHTFATLIQLMPLDQGHGNSKQDAAFLSPELLTRKSKDKEFLDFLFTPKKIPDFRVPVPINAELRTYQQSGVNWLWFLNKYKLHGILCDDMGLGKTLQTICILAGAHHERRQAGLTPLPSLVICPPTLTGHWVYEVNKFLSANVLRPLHYVGLPADRERLRIQVATHNLVIASYDIVRKDIEFFGGTHWNYVVLDEGHIIKNGKTKSSKAIKCVVANHRLILSGTPIQNNVLELWSLFDFLMPGFLGTEKQFISKFSRPILASRDAKSSAKDQEAGALAMEALHRQVLPFLLRRVKEDVLTDLPPKITQDLLCELSPLQERLYEDFSKTHLKIDIKDCLENMDEQTGALNKKTHVFQALRYLQNVCNHPKLVLTAQHPEQQRITQELVRMNSHLDDIEHSAKLPALKQLLLDCGIGVEDSLSVNQHRALIFCQLKAMLDIVENDLLKKHLPAVSYLRLDGAVPASARHNIVTKFNSDPSIDVLLLTTQVGGLGLNLTGADTVIFVEHDWNPMKDLQAMDRAHRIGQRKVVNVYRLITRKSLEEKIMGLQKFKLITANTIVNDENAAMDTMQTDQLFDLFQLSDQQLQQQKHDQNSKTRGGAGIDGGITMKQALENLPELWDDRQYEEEYDLTLFLQNLK